MKRFVYLLGVTALLSIDPASSQQWQLQTSPSAQDLWDVYFPAGNLGVAVGINGTIIRTVNGGSNWSLVSSPSIGRLNAVQFVDANIGTAVGFLGTILRTTNSGINWTQQMSSSSVLNDVHFFNTTNGIVTTGGDLLRTTNGGQTWSTQTVTTTRGLTKMAFADANTGVILAGGDRDNSFYFRTTNGGQTWTESMVAAPDGFLGIAFGSATVGTIVGPGGKIHRTTNAGVSWFSQTSGITSTLHAVSMFDANNAIAVGTFDLTLRTTNGGATWLSETNPLPGSGNLYNVQMISAGEAWAVGSGGSIIHRSPAVGVEEQNPSLPGQVELLQNYPNPFNPTTKISYRMPAHARATLRIFDLLGREIALLVDQEMEPGPHTVEWNASGFPAGVYLCRLSSLGRAGVRTMILVK